MRGGQVIGALGDVDAVAEDDRRCKGGRGRGELSEDAADLARAVNEDIVGPLESDGTAERLQPC